MSLFEVDLQKLLDDSAIWSDISKSLAECGGRAANLTYPLLYMGLGPGSMGAREKYAAAQQQATLLLDQGSLATEQIAQALLVVYTRYKNVDEEQAGEVRGSWQPSL